MAPAAVIPQTSAHPDTALDEKSPWNTMDSGALDFDLLAEYLLEDVGAGGFDFSSTDIASPPDALKGQQGVPQDPGVVTPNGGSSFVDPLAHAAIPGLQQPQAAAASLPASGDLSGELSQVQQLIGTQQANAAAPQPPPKPQPQTRPVTQQPLAANGITAIRHPPPPQQQKPPLAKPPVAPRQNGMAQPPNKRPKVAPPATKGPAYSFARAGGAPRALPVAPPTIPGVAGSRQKSQAQVDRRRERNRILARRTRLRKKFFFESLQKDVADLQRENAALKSIVRSRLKPADAKVILTQCDANERLPGAIGAEGVPPPPAAPVGPDARKLDREDFSLIQSIQNSQQCFVITDPSLHDNPIVYASDDFLTLTGYSQEEVLGRNCRFLQGTETCPNKVAAIRKGVAAGEDVNVTMVNYTSGGKPFWNSLFVAALRDADNNIVNFIGVIVKTMGPEPGDAEYGKVLKDSA